MAKAKNYLMWNMTRKCNFRCHYCYYPHDNSPVQENLPVDRLRQFLDGTGREWVVGMTGGEPFLYPNFVDLCAALTETHKVSVDTNLSLTKEVARFARQIDPKRVHDLYVALHVEERERRGGMDAFVRNVNELTGRGFNVVVNYVLHPDLIHRYAEDRDRLAEQGVTITPRPFKGVHEDREYPAAYPAEAKAHFSDHPDAGKKTVFDFCGVLCNGGRSFIRMEPDGTVYRCAGEKTVMGNLLTGIALYEEPMPCRARRCPCLGPNHVVLAGAESCQFEGIKKANVGNAGEARALYAEALATDPAMSTARINQGMILWEAGETERAEAEFRQAVADDPTDPYAAGNLAAALALRGQFPPARAVVREFMDSDAHKLDKRFLEQLEANLNAGESPAGWPRSTTAILPRSRRTVTPVLVSKPS
ncbi:radical SAM protein [Oceanidesulfovibrio indonesiensis]|uniref:Radical SAM protein n=1 Tax=Oceanidesulfovibrio indonesiensis TaxID=54767 RepID=A0A7M3MJK4_9BACT|nr:radical SAM protein [Oceanidesulfovibrio indonesiensis]TVM19999.1 radical SAM protein [Oceanidesulfovibrio indonesiensis]